MRKVIGVDLGGTEINAGVVNSDGEILKQTTLSSGASLGREEVLARIRKAIDELISDDIEAIGIGTPGFIDIDKGEVLSIGGNIKDWKGTKIREYLEEYYELPIFVENDANLAAICESWLGAGKDLDNFVMITLGTGVGGGIYNKDSGILHGSNFRAGEIGHNVLYPNGRKCSCGQKGCSERYISGTGVEESYFLLTNKIKTGREIFKNYKRDPFAREAIDSFIEDLGIFIINIKNTFDPEAVIIGGGLINSSELWWEKVIDYYTNNANDSSGTKILKAEYLNDSGLIGAGKLAFNRE